MTDNTPRLDATSSEHDFTLTIEETADRYVSAGHPRTIRAIQKYCARGDLDCQKAETAFGQRYLITPASVARHIAQIEDVSQTPIRVPPRSDAVVHTLSEEPTSHQEPNAPVREQPRPAGTEYVARLEGENEFLRKQIGVKDEQIKDLTERARETNHLIAGLQKMLTPLLDRPQGQEPKTT